MSAGRPSNISPTQNCAKVFIQRDYSYGTTVRFQTQLPNELEDKVRNWCPKLHRQLRDQLYTCVCVWLVCVFQVERSAFEYTVNHLNAFFAEAEDGTCKAYCQGCCACLTAYLMFICVESHYEKVGQCTGDGRSMYADGCVPLK